MLFNEALLHAFGSSAEFSFSLPICFEPLGVLQSWLLTLDNLKRRGRALAYRCFLCGEGEETVDHLLIHFSKARILWELLLAIFGVSWVFPLSVKETLLSWKGSFVGKHHKKA